MNQAIIAEAAVSNKSILIAVNTVTRQHTQQKIPPHNIGLNLQAAPVMKVGNPYSKRKSGEINSLKRNGER